MKLITPDILKIFEALEPHTCKLVGGCVRDFLQNGTIAEDIDIATTASPSEVSEILKSAGMHVIPTGIKHGTVTCVYNNKPYEITTLRKDIQTNGRHAKVIFTKDFKEDSLRRDFTFNALYMNKNGELSDYHNGQEDLKKRSVCFIGNPQDRIEEDYLRILRYFRFHGKFSQKPQFKKDVLSLIKQQSPHLKNLSKERVTSEILKTLQGFNIGYIWQKMQDTHVLHELNLPKPDIKTLTKVEELYKLNALEKLVCLHPNIQISKKTLILSNKEKKYIKDIQKCLKAFNAEKDIYQQAYILGKSSLTAALKILYAQTKVHSLQKEIPLLEKWQVPTFPLKGQDLIDLGYTPSPQFGEMLKKIEEAWIQKNFPQKEWCLQQARQLDK